MVQTKSEGKAGKADVLPVSVVKARIVDGYGDVVEGYMMVDSEEVRVLDVRPQTCRVLSGWAANALRKSLGLPEKAETGPEEK